MSLRRLFAFLSLGFFTLAALTASALVIWTERIEDLADLSSKEMQSVRASNELQVNLLKFSRATLLNLSKEMTTPSDVRIEHESVVREALRNVRLHAESQEEAVAIDEIELLVNQYISFVHQRARLDPKEAAQSTAPSLLDNALARAQMLAELNVRQADEIEVQIRDESDYADLMAGIVAILSILTWSAAWLAMRNGFFRPIGSLREKIDSFSGTDSHWELDEIGPEEIRSIAAAFNRLASRVSAQREASLRFLAAVAHDLRNPLGAIRMSSDLLTEDESAAEDREVIVQIISRQAQQLDRMVGDLLDTTRIEAGQLEMKPSKTDLSRLVEEGVILHRSLSQLHQIDVSLPARPVLAVIDPLRISQVINNLLSNAIKYSPSGGVIRVKLTDESGRAALEVTDTGIGIPSDEKDKIFEPFRRATATRNTIPGVGLGLSVTKRIVEAHSGSIEIESTPGKGSTFRISLPTLPLPSVSPPSSPKK